MKYFSTAYVYIVFYGDNLQPKEFSDYLNMEPTDTGLKGEKGRFGAILKDTFWEYKLEECGATDELDTALNKLTNILNNKVITIKNYIHKRNIKSKCYIVIKSKNNEDTGVVLGNDFISFLHQLKMQVEIDVYSHGSEV